ncbi:hypothetical protein LEP1GSC163_2624 [Leptospira santarosai str. CBC379]|nr:hypothetical protein LEP1GSC163_2624 [Leptospira santarosai str. CBC379]
MNNLHFENEILQATFNDYLSLQNKIPFTLRTISVLKQNFGHPVL